MGDVLSKFITIFNIKDFKLVKIYIIYFTFDDAINPIIFEKSEQAGEKQRKYRNIYWPLLERIQSDCTRNSFYRDIDWFFKKYLFYMFCSRVVPIFTLVLKLTILDKILWIIGIFKAESQIHFLKIF